MDGVTQDSFISVYTQVEYRINKRARQGVVFVFPLVLLPIILLQPSEAIASEVRLSATIICIALALVGFVYSMHWGRNGRRYLHGLKILNLLTPPYPFIGSRIGCMDKSPIYIIVKWGATQILFIRLLEPEHATHGRTQLPRFLSRKHYTHQIDGIRIYRRENVFSFPKSQNEYVMGEGILYGLPLQKHFWVPKKSPISTDILLKIVKQLSLDLAQRIED